MFEELKKEHLEKRFSVLRKLISVPKSGWIKIIRNSYGMTSQQLANRLGVSQPSVINLEKSEIEKTIKLETLENVANALNCDLQYCLVPRVPIDDYISRQATKKASYMLKEVTNSMELEDQAVDETRKRSIFERFYQECIKNPRKYLWGQND